MRTLMIILKKKELQKHQKILGGFLLPVLLSVLLVFSLVFPLSYSKAEEATSNQLLENRGFEDSTNTTTVPEWTVEGDGYVCNTCGPWGGNAVMTDKGGGAISQSVDLFDTMTQGEVNNGFDLTYGADVYSYSNNATVPACSGIEGQDCKDTFSITLTINDSTGNQLQQFVHEYKDISWTGWDTSTYDNFTSTVPSNEYTSAIATLRLYGIDEGFTGNGWGGPRADNTHLSVTYTTQATLDIIAAAVDEAMEIVNQQIDAATDIATEPQSFEITINDPVGNEIESFSIEIESTPDVNVSTIETAIEMAPVEMEIPSFDIPVSTGSAEVEVQVEVASVEMEMNNDIGQSMDTESPEPQGGTATEVEPEPSTPEPESQEASAESESTESEPTSSQGESESSEATTDEDSSNEPEIAENEQESQPEVQSANKQKSGSRSKSKSKSVKQTKRQAKQKVANKIVKNMGDKGRYDSTNQIRTLVVMGVLGNSRSFFSAQRLPPDTPNFFTSDTIPDNTIADNTGAAYYMIGGSSVVMDQLIESQYR